MPKIINGKAIIIEYSLQSGNKAIHNGTVMLAICGGYAQAFQMLLDRAGIENYTVSGVSSGEYHMWNYVLFDGKWYYCDPTADRGGMENHFMLTAEELNAVGTYSWDETFLEKITRDTR